MSSAVDGARRPLPVAPHDVTGGRATGFWGVLTLIATEAVFFAILFVSYLYLRFQHGVEWPPGGIEKPSLALVAVMTPVLVLSSVPAHIAETGIRRGNLRRLRLGLAVTILQAAVFVGLTVIEWMEKVREFLPWTNVYGSLFYTILGFHGVHVAVGILLLAWLLVYALRGRWTRENHGPVQNVILYWHFVDLVWLFIVTLIYVSPRWWP